MTEPSGAAEVVAAMKNWAFLPEHEQLTRQLFGHEFTRARDLGRELELSPDLLDDLEVLHTMFGDVGVTISGLMRELLEMAVDDVLLRLEAMAGGL